MQSQTGLLIDHLWSPTDKNSYMRKAIFVVAGIVALIISAKIKFHFDLIAPPFTMQTAVVLFLAASMGWRLGAMSVIGYLMLGAMGQPVFAGTPEKGIGLAYMMSYTGGYLFGFLAMTFAVGYGAEKGLFRNQYVIFPIILLGSLGILFFGFLYLGGLLNSYQAAWNAGVAPFLVIEVVKAVLVSASLVILGVFTR